MAPFFLLVAVAVAEAAPFLVLEAAVEEELLVALCLQVVAVEEELLVGFCLRVVVVAVEELPVALCLQVVAVEELPVPLDHRHQ